METVENCVVSVAEASEQKSSPDGLRLKIAKFPQGKFSAQLATNTDQEVHNKILSAYEQAEETSQLSGDGSRDVVLEGNEDMSLDRLSKSDSQSTCSLKSGKQGLDTDVPCKPANGIKNPAVTLDHNFDRQLGKKISTKDKDVDSHTVLCHGTTALKDSTKSDILASRTGMEQSHMRHRSSSDGNGNRHHHRHRGRHLSDKPGTEHRPTLRNGEQLVPPLKIRLEHSSKTAGQQTAAYSVNSGGSGSRVDDIDALNKTGDTKHTETAQTAHAADNRTEKGGMPADQYAVAKKDDTRNIADQRRARIASGARPMPAITKKRLTFEESLIAGTCISITSNSAVGSTDPSKVSAATPSALHSEAIHSVQEGAQAAPKLVADTKPTSVLNIQDKKDLNSAKKIKLEDERSASHQHLNTARKAFDEVKVKQRSSEDSDHVKILSHTITVDEESESNLIESKSVSVHPDIKCDINRDPISSDNKSKCEKSSGTGRDDSTNEVSRKNSLAEEPQSQLMKRRSSERTSRHHHHHEHHRHSSSNMKPHRMTGSQLDYELRQSRHGSSKYGPLMHVETHPNGGASVVHAFEDELAALSPRELSEFVQEFFRVVFDEDPVGVPRHVMGIVHNSAAYLPDILEYFASAHPDMIVKRNLLGKSSDVETTTIGEYFQLVLSTYLAGTYRTGPLDHFSIVGTKAEETGGFFPEFLDLLDQNEFLKYVSPWGKISELENMPRNQSNDGPIVWARPGEQVVPTADMPKSPMVKKR